MFLFNTLLPFSARGNESSDYISFYEPVARQILDGRGPVLSGGQAATRYPPGYPLLLAGLFRAARALDVPEGAVLTVFSALSVALASLLLFELAASVWPRRYALLAPLGLTTYPLLLWLTKQPSSEVPFVIVLFGCVLLLLSVVRGAAGAATRAIGCGAAAGGAMLIRPIALGLGLLLAGLVATLVRGGILKRLGLAALLLAGNLAVVLPWEVWVYNRTATVIPLSTGGIPAIRDGIAFGGSQKGFRQPVGLPADLAVLEADIESHYRELRSVSDILKLFAEEWGQRPGAVLKLLAWKAVRSWYATDSRRYENVILAAQIPYALLLAGCLAAAWRQRGQARQLAIVSLLVIAYFWAMSFVGLSIVRYMVPAIGLGFALLPAIRGARGAGSILRRVGSACVPSPEDPPFVSVIMPVRNEAPFIAANLSAVLRQDYPNDRFEVIVADGRSTDGTRQIVESMVAAHPQIRLVDNQQRIVSTGLNAAIALARGGLVVRLDGHCEYPRDYVRQVVALRERTGAANVGGVLVPVGSTNVQRAICIAYASRIGIGGAALRAQPESDETRVVDSVHGGCWRRQTLIDAGPFAEDMVRNQDDEMSFRLRRAGGRIVQSASIRVRYVVRDTWRKLFLQFFQYGYWKVRVVRKHPRQASVRHLMPALLVLTLTVGALWGTFCRPAALGALGAGLAYLATMTVAAFAAAGGSQVRLWPKVVVAFLIMHVGYGCGFLMGLLALAGRPAGIDTWFSSLSR